MTMTSISAVIKTNVPRQSIRKDFLSKLTEYLCETYNTESKRIIVEIHPDTPMMRGGLSAPMMNIEFYHNSDVISQTTKAKHATGMAKFMGEELRIPIDRHSAQVSDVAPGPLVLVAFVIKGRSLFHASFKSFLF